MTLSHHVTSRELSEKLKRAGVPQASQFYWMKPIGDNGKPNGEYFINYKDSYDFCDDDSHDHKMVSAFLASELGELLPRKINKGKLWLVIETLNDGKGWACGYRNAEHWLFLETDTLPNVMAEMLLFLVENKLIDVTSLIKRV